MNINKVRHLLQKIGFSRGLNVENAKKMPLWFDFIGCLDTKLGRARSKQLVYSDEESLYLYFFA